MKIGNLYKELAETLILASKKQNRRLTKKRGLQISEVLSEAIEYIEMVCPALLCEAKKDTQEIVINGDIDCKEVKVKFENKTTRIVLKKYGFAITIL